MRKLLCRLYFFATGLALFLLLSGTFLAFQGTATTLPTTNLNGAPVPDWERITFDSLPGISSNGSFQATPDMVQQLGYDPSRTWTSGQKPALVSALGDFQDSFKLQNFDLQGISQLTGIDLSQTSLAEFGAMPLQSLDSLVKAVPSLKDFPINQVLPVNDLIAQSVGSFDPEQTIGQLLEQAPQLGDLSFANLDLSKYKIPDIPNLEITQLAAFQNWQGVKIQDVPGLSQVPFSQFGITADGTQTATVDVVFGAAEQQRNRTISGSDVEGFGVPCDKGCGHIELSAEQSNVLGRQWISGKYQEVKGGKGALASVNGGKEPTGRHPFGEAFKLVVWDLSETQATGSIAMFFRMCIRNATVDLGCTPYFMGPVPLMTFKENAPIFLGRVENSSSSSPSTPTTVALQEMQSAQNELAQARSQNSTQASRGSVTSSNSFINNGQTSNPLSSFLPPSADCRHQYQDVKLDALSTALSAVESNGNFGSVGNFVCDKAGNCGRALGDKQFMSYRPDVRSMIASKPGGSEFLKGLDGGSAVTSEQVLMYFPPADQQQLFASDSQNLINIAASQIDPTTGQPFTGERLIERVAQMHFGGASVPVDSPATDAHGQLTVKSYGQKVLQQYNQSLSLMGC